MCRLQQLSLSNSLLLNLQLDCALLCDELGARGEVDSLAGAAMTTSNTLMEQAGLQEMLVSRTSFLQHTGVSAAVLFSMVLWALKAPDSWLLQPMVSHLPGEME